MTPADRHALVYRLEQQVSDGYLIADDDGFDHWLASAQRVMREAAAALRAIEELLARLGRDYDEPLVERVRWLVLDYEKRGEVLDAANKRLAALRAEASTPAPPETGCSHGNIVGACSWCDLRDAGGIFPEILDIDWARVARIRAAVASVGVTEPAQSASWIDVAFLLSCLPTPPVAAPPETGWQEKYQELLYAVARKFPGESRHETALRYIRQAEERSVGGPCAAPPVAAPPETGELK